jgi:hypothetical protein
MGVITPENMSGVLTKLRLQRPQSDCAQTRDVTEQDVAIAREWFSRLPQGVLDDPGEPLEARAVLEMASERYGALQQEDVVALELAAYGVMMDQICEVLNGYVEYWPKRRRKVGSRRATRLRARKRSAEARTKETCGLR